MKTRAQSTYLSMCVLCQTFLINEKRSQVFSSLEEMYFPSIHFLRICGGNNNNIWEILFVCVRLGGCISLTWALSVFKQCLRFSEAMRNITLFSHKNHISLSHYFEQLLLDLSFFVLKWLIFSSILYNNMCISYIVSFLMCIYGFYARLLWCSWWPLPAVWWYIISTKKYIIIKIGFGAKKLGCNWVLLVSSLIRV